MAKATVKVTLGGSLGEGRYSTTAAGEVDQVAAAVALEAAVTTAIAAAAANATIAGDSTALGLVNAITTAFTPLVAAITAIGANGDVIVIANKTTITSNNAFDAALLRAKRFMFGSSGWAS